VLQNLNQVQVLYQQKLQLSELDADSNELGKIKRCPDQTEIIQLTFSIDRKSSKPFNGIDTLSNVDSPQTFFRWMWGGVDADPVLRKDLCSSSILANVQLISEIDCSALHSSGRAISVQTQRFGPERSKL
jgi:hypothetical protein